MWSSHYWFTVLSRQVNISQKYLPSSPPLLWTWGDPHPTFAFSLELTSYLASLPHPTFAYSLQPTLFPVSGHHPTLFYILWSEQTSCDIACLTMVLSCHPSLLTALPLLVQPRNGPTPDCAGPQNTQGVSNHDQLVLFASKLFLFSGSQPDLHCAFLHAKTPKANCRGPVLEWWWKEILQTCSLVK